MAKIEIYTTARCPYCNRAKMLLDRKKVFKYQEFRVDRLPEKHKEMLVRSHGNRAVPQIFIDDMAVGGFDDLWLLDQKGELDAMLS